MGNILYDIKLQFMFQKVLNTNIIFVYVSNISYNLEVYKCTCTKVEQNNKNACYMPYMLYI